jgi:hypothetical protein
LLLIIWNGENIFLDKSVQIVYSVGRGSKLAHKMKRKIWGVGLRSNLFDDNKSPKAQKGYNVINVDHFIHYPRVQLQVPPFYVVPLNFHKDYFHMIHTILRFLIFKPYIFPFLLYRFFRFDISEGQNPRKLSKF